MLLSIIIPIYNNFHQLKKCLKSISCQTVFDDINNWSPDTVRNQQMEVIVVDDGSQVRTYADGYADLRGKIKFYKIKHAGASAARNFGFSKSSGNYVFFCDADVEFLKKDALEKMIKILEANPDKAYCYCGFRYGFKNMPSFSFDVKKLKENNYISTMSLIRQEKFIGFDESLKRFQDWDLWLSMLEHGDVGFYIPEILFKVNSGGKMSSWLPSFFYKLPVLSSTKQVKEFEKAKEMVKKKHNLG